MQRLSSKQKEEKGIRVLEIHANMGQGQKKS